MSSDGNCGDGLLTAAGLSDTDVHCLARVSVLQTRPHGCAHNWDGLRQKPRLTNPCYLVEILV